MRWTLEALIAKANTMSDMLGSQEKITLKITGRAPTMPEQNIKIKLYKGSFLEVSKNIHITDPTTDVDKIIDDSCEDILVHLLLNKSWRHAVTEQKQLIK